MQEKGVVYPDRASATCLSSFMSIFKILLVLRSEGLGGSMV